MGYLRQVLRINLPYPQVVQRLVALRKYLSHFAQCFTLVLSPYSVILFLESNFLVTSIILCSSHLAILVDKEVVNAASLSVLEQTYTTLQQVFSKECLLLTFHSERLCDVEYAIVCKAVCTDIAWLIHLICRLSIGLEATLVSTFRIRQVVYSAIDGVILVGKHIALFRIELGIECSGEHSPKN